ncbi:MAG: hypothetical protein V4580_06640 [Bacteroidota bacterium]
MSPFFKYYSICLTSLLVSGCIIVNTPGFYNGYKKLSDEEKKSVVLLKDDDSISQLKKDTTIYAINGKQLKNCLAANDTSVVYLWGPRCSSVSCILISSCQDYCTQRSYKLYVVADYYDIEMMNAQNKANTPLLIANHIYYNRYYAGKLNSAFTSDLLNGTTLRGREQYNRFLFFKGDEFIFSKSNLF